VTFTQFPEASQVALTVQIPPFGQALSARFEQLWLLNVLLQTAIHAVEFRECGQQGLES
jgi:hypothetical protein